MFKLGIWNCVGRSTAFMVACYCFGVFLGNLQPMQICCPITPTQATAAVRHLRPSANLMPIYLLGCKHTSENTLFAHFFFTIFRFFFKNLKLISNKLSRNLNHGFQFLHNNFTQNGLRRLRSKKGLVIK